MLTDAVIAIGPFAIFTVCVFVTGFLCGALLAQVRSLDPYGDLALRLGVSSESIRKAIYGRLQT